MTELQKSHYFRMLGKNRAIPFMLGNKIVGFLTFYITNDIEPYVNDNPWAVLVDDKNGNICYINQLLTDASINNFKYFKNGFNSFIDFIRQEFPKVDKIIWRKYHKHSNIVTQHTKELNYEQIHSTVA